MSGMCLFFSLVLFVCGGVIGASAMALLQINHPMPEPEQEEDSVLG